MRPRTFKALMDTHADIQNKMYGGGSKKNKKAAAPQVTTPGFIDQIPGW